MEDRICGIRIIKAAYRTEVRAKPLVKALGVLYKPGHSAEFDVFGRHDPDSSCVANRLDLTYSGG